jgi:hypothetical protein
MAPRAIHRSTGLIMGPDVTENLHLEQILAMEASLSSGLGVEVRLLAYEYLINQLPPSVMAEKIAYEAPLIERLLTKA